jgi:hypothetical protein
MKIEQEMNISTAVHHFSWRLKQPKMIPSQRDREAFNCIVNTLNQHYEKAQMEDVLLAKLLIEKLMMLTIGGQRSMKSAIDVIKEILSASLSAWAKTFAGQVPLIRLKNVFDEEYIKVPRTSDAIKDAVNVVKAKHHLYKSYNEKLYEAAQPYTIEEFEGFIKKLIFDLKKEYQNNP